MDLDVAAFARDKAENVLGEERSRIQFRLDSKEYARLMKGTLGHSTTVPLIRKPADVKVVIYEFGSENATYAVARVR